MNEEIKTYDIFISHSHHDEKLSHQIKNLLEIEGYQCWIAPDCIEPGMVWAEAIQDGISSSRVFLLIYSGHSNLSNQVWREITLAVANQLYIISYKCEDVPLSEVMKYFTATTHFIGFPPTDPESRIKELIRKVKEVIPLNQTNDSENDNFSTNDDWDLQAELDRICQEMQNEKDKSGGEPEKVELKYDVFLSYPDQDVKLANAIRERMDNKGMVCCDEIDRDSEDFAEKTIYSIEQSKLTLFLYTKNTNASKNQLRELILSSNRGKIIFPVKMIADNPSSGLEYYLCDNHWLDIHSEPEETQVKSIVDSLILFMYGDEKSDGSYDILQNAAGEILIILNFKASHPDNPRLVFDGGDTAMLYRNKESAVSINNIKDKAIDALYRVEHVLVVEVSNKTNDVVREYFVPVHKIISIEGFDRLPKELKEKQVFDEDEYDEFNSRYDILQDTHGEIVIIIGLMRGAPINPRFLIDNKGNAFLYRNHESGKILEYINSQAANIILKSDHIVVVEVMKKSESVARKYNVPVVRINHWLQFDTSNMGI